MDWFSPRSLPHYFLFVVRLLWFAFFSTTGFILEVTMMKPNKSLQPTPVGAGSSAFAVHVIGPARLSSSR